jgi:hypothetical protein
MCETAVTSMAATAARAYRAGHALPPVAVIERPDGYYLLDGRHRVSVARALGHRDIDAWASPAPPTRPARAPQSPSVCEDRRCSSPRLHVARS